MKTFMNHEQRLENTGLGQGACRSGCWWRESSRCGMAREIMKIKSRRSSVLFLRAGKAEEGS